MQEFIFTLVVIFILFRIFGRHVFVFNIHKYNSETEQKRDHTPITKSQKPSVGKKDEGEYIDYEEIKE